MKRIPHTHTLQGFFNELTPEALRLFSDRLQMLVQNSSKHFSLNLPSEPRSQIEVSFTVSFREETVQSDSYAPSVLDEFRQEMQKNWSRATILVNNTQLTDSLMIRLLGSFKNEKLEVSFDSEAGYCTAVAHLANSRDTEQLLLGIWSDLGLSERPLKHSRNISESLETKLLCDSMHLCNVCREPGVIVHHIVSVEDAGKSEEENLIVLCPNHHNQAHQRSMLSRGLKPSHLKEYKKRHLAWVAGKGNAGTAAGNEVL